MKEKLAIFSLIFALLTLVGGFCFTPVAEAMDDEMTNQGMHSGMADSSSFMPCCEESDPDHSNSLFLGKIENGKIIVDATGEIDGLESVLRIKKQQQISSDIYFSPPEGEKLASVIKKE